jgi:hypothetical protein
MQTYEIQRTPQVNHTRNTDFNIFDFDSSSVNPESIFDVNDATVENLTACL